MNIKKFFQGEERTVKAKKNILGSIFIKGLDSVIYLLLVPVTLGYLNPYEYGIWLTLNSILMWINSFDVGLGNGMRNKLAAALARGDKELGRIYVSTTFLMLIVLMGTVIFIGTIVEPFINWYDILSASPESVHNLSMIVYVSFGIFCLNFIFKFIGNVYLALQLPAINNLLVVSGHLIALVVIYILTLTTVGNLFYVALVYSIAPLLVYLIAFPITFKKIYPYLAPSIKYFRKQYLKDLFNIGIQFFLLQLSAILLFSFANILISHMFGPEKVTPYNIAYRYFSVVLMGMNLIMAPIWSATTDAYEKGDIEWIKKAKKKTRQVLIMVTVGIGVMIGFSEWIYQLWVGSKVHIPFVLSALIGCYVSIIIWSMSYSSFLNGLGKLRVQTINTVIIAILFIPLCGFLGKLYGIQGIVIGMCILNFSGLILNKTQFDKIIENKATGIWLK